MHRRDRAQDHHQAWGNQGRSDRSIHSIPPLPVLGAVGITLSPLFHRYPSGAFHCISKELSNCTTMCYCRCNERLKRDDVYRSDIYTAASYDETTEGPWLADDVLHTAVIDASNDLQCSSSVLSCSASSASFGEDCAVTSSSTPSLAAAAAACSRARTHLACPSAAGATLQLHATLSVKRRQEQAAVGSPPPAKRRSPVPLMAVVLSPPLTLASPFAAYGSSEAAGLPSCSQQSSAPQLTTPRGRAADGEQIHPPPLEMVSSELLSVLSECLKGMALPCPVDSAGQPLRLCLATE